MADERRRAARHPFFASAEITEPRSRYSVTAQTNELSRHGCHIDILSPLASGSLVKVRILHGGEAIDVAARVAHSRPNVGMGLSFDATDAPDVLERWLADLPL
jgi:hypothetical protein